MTDDRQHEYVPPVARDILDGQRIAAVAAYDEAQRKAYNLQISYDDAMAMLSALPAVSRSAVIALEIYKGANAAMRTQIERGMDEADELMAKLDQARLDLRELRADLSQAEHDHTKMLIERNESLAQVAAIAADRDGYRNRWQMLERDIEPLRAKAGRVPILEENCARLAAERDELRLEVGKAKDGRTAARAALASMQAERDDLLALLREAYLHAGRWHSDPEGEFQAWIAEANGMRHAPRPAWER